jgi:hypothetical protein
VGLISETKGLRELSEIQRWIIIPALKQVPGVADVQNFGGITTQFELELDPQQLVRYNLSLANVEAAINANSASAGGSVVTRGELGYVVRGIGMLQTLDDMGAIVVTQRNGLPILVRDLGKLKLANQERHGILGKNRENDGVEGTVLLLKGDNPSRVMDGIHAKVAELNARLKSNDVRIVPYLDRSDLVDATVSKVSHTILQGVGLVLIVLILFLGSVRSALIVGITIPFALVTAFILMHLTKIPANLLSLAIDFGFRCASPRTSRRRMLTCCTTASQGRGLSLRCRRTTKWYCRRALSVAVCPANKASFTRPSRSPACIHGLAESISRLPTAMIVPAWWMTWIGSGVGSGTKSSVDPSVVSAVVSGVASGVASRVE